jgi:hypothetical protein
MALAVTNCGMMAAFITEVMKRLATPPFTDFKANLGTGQ